MRSTPPNAPGYGRDLFRQRTYWSTDQPDSCAKPKPYNPRHPERTLLCPLCGGQMRIIVCITHSADIRQILEHIGVQPEGNWKPFNARKKGRIGGLIYPDAEERS